MAHVLRLTDGTTTINLAEGDNYIAGYAPRSPDLSTIDFAPAALRDGGERFATTRRNITEAARIGVTASTIEDVRATIRSIELMLRNAEEHQKRGVGAPVYVEFDPGMTGTIYRSEILSGKVDYPENILAYEWATRNVVVNIAWTRRFYWEGPEAELPLTNGNGTNVTGGLTVYNHDDADAGHDNYVQVAGNDVVGAIPAPIRIGFLNSYDVSARTSFFYYGLNAFSNPTTFPHALEGENRNYVVGGAPPSSDSSCSGGQFQIISWAESTDIYFIGWQLSPAMLQACAGNQFRVLARFSSTPPGGVRLKTRLTAPSGYRLSVLAEGPEVPIGTVLIQDLGIIKIPPGTIQGTNLEAIDLCLYGRRAGGGTMGIDFVQLIPVDGFRKLWPRGYSAAYNTRTVDDGIEGRIWNEWADGTDKSGQFVGFGAPPHIWPGRTQRIYLLTTHDGGGAEIARTHVIQIWYRPRRLTL